MGTEGTGGEQGESTAEAEGRMSGAAAPDGRAAGPDSREVREFAGPAGSKASDPAERVRLPWLRVRDQVVVAVLAGLVLVSLAVYYGQKSGWGRREIELKRLPEHELDYRIDPNRAEWVEWMQLPGIGKTLADRIVKDREERGPFESVDDLLRVRGIGKVNLERIRPYLRMGEEKEDRSQETEDRSRKSEDESDRSNF